MGEEGWIWVTRGRYRAGEPAEGKRVEAIDAHDPRMLREGIEANELRTCTPARRMTITWIG
ncbi:MAG: hypothetical protein U5J83_19475 [Bryobacterales bacterium]|nr:hypothetical protein [Bryobacterales bacterium]